MCILYDGMERVYDFVQIYTWVVCNEADDGPAAGGDGDGVALLRIDEVELGRVRRLVVVAEALCEDEEVEAMEVHRVALLGHQPRVLQHHLHRRVVLERLHLGRLERVLQRRVIVRCVSGVVEDDRRRVGEVAGVDAVDGALVHGLEHGGGVREDEGGVVHARREDGPFVVWHAHRLLRSAEGVSHGDGDEHVGVDGERHTVRHQRRHIGEKPVRGGRVVVLRHVRHHGWRGRRAAAVLDDGRAVGQAVQKTWVGSINGAVVRDNRHVVAPADGRGDAGVRYQERVHRLPRRDDHHVGLVRLGVARVGGHHVEAVVGHLEEERRGERSVDDPEHVRLVLLQLELVRFCQQKKNTSKFIQDTSRLP